MSVSAILVSGGLSTWESGNRAATDVPRPGPDAMVSRPPQISAVWASSGKPSPVRFRPVVKNGSRARACLPGRHAPAVVGHAQGQDVPGRVLVDRDAHARRPGRDGVLDDVEDVE